MFSYVEAHAETVFSKELRDGKTYVVTKKSEKWSDTTRLIRLPPLPSQYEPEGPVQPDQKTDIVTYSHMVKFQEGQLALIWQESLMVEEMSTDDERYNNDYRLGYVVYDVAESEDNDFVVMTSVLSTVSLRWFRKVDTSWKVVGKQRLGWNMESFHFSEGKIFLVKVPYVLVNEKSAPKEVFVNIPDVNSVRPSQAD